MSICRGTGHSIIEFWRRWHITLSRFLKNYIYIPLGGAKHGHFIKTRNLLITMLIGGIWHGAGWSFIIWGLLHGFYLVINHLWRTLSKSNKFRFLSGNTLNVFLYWPLTFCSVCIAWGFFRAETLSSAINIIRSMLGINGISLPKAFQSYFINLENYHISFIGIFPNGLAEFNHEVIWLIISFIITLLLPNSNKIFGYYRISKVIAEEKNGMLTVKKYFSPNIFIAFSAAIALWICIVSINSYSEFLYFQF